MVRRRSKKGVLATIIVLALTIVIVGGFALWQGTNIADTTPDTPDTNVSSDTDADTPDGDEQDTSEDPANPIDTSNTATVAIEPLGIELTYSRAVAGFEFEILRTSSGTQYVELSSSRLIGTKCTDDTGVFASIIQNPVGEEDRSTITETVAINEDTYGLSLASSTCTDDATLFEQYQQGIAPYFRLLSAWPTR